MDGPSADPREIWDQRFSHLQPLERPRPHRPTRSRHRTTQSQRIPDAFYEPWLERWMPLLRTMGTTPVLDLGCGSGRDACYLTSYGLPVLVADFSRQALRLTEQTTQGACAHAIELDIRNGLPFRRKAFRIIIANLSLHYHRWPQTNLIVENVRQRLKSEGYLLARFNSTNDVNYGAQSHQEVEPRCYIVDGVLKRFFNRDDFQALFQDGWRVQSLQEQLVYCYQKPKTVWEIVAQRAQGETDVASHSVTKNADQTRDAL
ncbi:MAG: class I SAM-dependent methyltransferase [Anaerolineae bacterium]